MIFGALAYSPESNAARWSLCPWLFRGPIALLDTCQRASGRVSVAKRVTFTLGSIRHLSDGSIRSSHFGFTRPRASEK